MDVDIDMDMDVGMNRSGQRANPCKDWVDEGSWDNITELDNLVAFSGLALSFEQVSLLVCADGDTDAGGDADRGSRQTVAAFLEHMARF